MVGAKSAPGPGDLSSSCGKASAAGADLGGLGTLALAGTEARKALSLLIAGAGMALAPHLMEEMGPRHVTPGRAYKYDRRWALVLRPRAERGWRWGVWTARVGLGPSERDVM